MSLTLVVLGPWFTRIWVGEDLVPSLGLLAWTAAFTVILGIAAQYAILILAVERIQPAAALAVATAVAAILGSVVFARTVGINGPMIAAAGAILVIFVPGITLLARDILRSLDAAHGLSGR